MGLAELVLLAVGLSMDAFAVSICKGLGMKKINLKVAVVLGLFFGGFQAGMPVIGWALGSQFMGIIGPIDYWIAFILLAFIGGKMLIMPWFHIPVQWSLSVVGSIILISIVASLTLSRKAVAARAPAGEEG